MPNTINYVTQFNNRLRELYGQSLTCDPLYHSNTDIQIVGAKEVDLQINEIKREINKAQNKVIRPRIKSLALASSDPVRLTNYSLNISPDIEKKNENNSPQEVANSGNGGIIESGKTKKCYIHPDKVNKFLLLPGAKHSKDFFDVGYTPDDHDLLVSDITKEYNYGKAVEKRQKGNVDPTVRLSDPVTE